MRALNRSFKRLFNFTPNRRGDKRLREKIESHIAAQTEENIRAGMGPEEARRHARLKFGAIETLREDYHAEEGLPAGSLATDKEQDKHGRCDAEQKWLLRVKDVIYPTRHGTAVNH